MNKIKRQAEREDGQLLILPSETEEAGVLSSPTNDLSSTGKGTTKNETDKGVEEKITKTKYEQAKDIIDEYIKTNGKSNMDDFNVLKKELTDDELNSLWLYLENKKKKSIQAVLFKSIINHELGTRKKTELNKAENAKSKGGATIAEKIASEKARQAAIDKAQSEVNFWEQVVGTAKRRKAEAEAEQKREPGDLTQAAVSVSDGVVRTDGDNRGSRIDGENRGNQGEETQSEEVIGRPLSAFEAENFIADMEKNADTAPDIELTIENWDALFGESGIVSTPIGEVKMGENQFAKLMRQDREGKLGMIKPTLEHPHVIVEDTSEAKGDNITERASSYVFIRSFKKVDGSRYYYFTSVTVSKDGNEVVISNQEKSKKRISNLLQNGVISWINKNVQSVSEIQSGESVLLDDSQTATQADNNTASLGINSSEPSTGKGTTKNETDKGVEEKIAEAEKEVDTNPTENQKLAGNYKKGHVNVEGYDVTIENPKGSVRRGTDKNGRQWEQKMNNTYGYIRGTQSVDGDHIDIFLSDNPTQGEAFVVDQVNEDGSFDEHKVMYGFNSLEEAKAAYLSNYEEGWKGLGTITQVSKEEFRKWIESSHRKTKPFAEYKSLNTKQKSTEDNKVDSETKYLQAKDIIDEYIKTNGKSNMDDFNVLKKELTDDELNSLWLYLENKKKKSIQVVLFKSIINYELTTRKNAENTKEVEQQQKETKNKINDPLEEIEDKETYVEEQNKKGGEVKKKEEKVGNDALEETLNNKETKSETKPTIDPNIESLVDKVNKEYEDYFKKGVGDENTYYESEKKLTNILTKLSNEELETIINNLRDKGKYTKTIESILDDVNEELKNQNKLKDYFAQAKRLTTGAKEKAKNIALKLLDYSAKDKQRPSLTGVYHDPDGYAVSTDAHILVALKEKVDKETSGKIIDKNGDVIEGFFPKWQKLLRTYGDNVSVNFEALRDFCAGALKECKDAGLSKKDIENKIVYVRFKNGTIILFNLPLLYKFANAAINIGANNVNILGFNSSVIAQSDKGYVLLMPLIPTDSKGNLAVDFPEEDYAYDEQEEITETKQANKETTKQQTKDETIKEVAVEPTEKIEDVGEKIGGARKDIAVEFKQRAQEALEKSTDDLEEWIRETPISKIFNFDLQKLRESGMSNEVISFIKICKQAIPAKPKLNRKLVSWAAATMKIYQMCLQAGTNWSQIKSLIEGSYSQASFAKMYQAYMAVGGFDGGLELNGAMLQQLGEDSGGYKNGERYSLKGQWYISNAGSYGGIYETKEKAIEALRKYAGENAVPKGKKIEFVVYQRRNDGTCFITPKGKSDIIIQDGFKTSKEATDYRKEHGAELEERYRTLMTGTTAKFDENRERKGRDYRGGKNVSAQEFMDAFGFRGVEFGNWTNQNDRQNSINEAYDALMDLADVLGVSPKALSLNGTLGMAFGARGQGKANAHYEPGKVVINLTKTRGYGSLAHEWFHALDNYFASMVGVKGGYATDTHTLIPTNTWIYNRGEQFTYKDERGKELSGEELIKRFEDYGVRKEMAEAWVNLMDKVRQSDYYKRSGKYAQLHGSKYWVEPTELGARAFSKWVENELSKRNATNDYLANNPALFAEELDDTVKEYKPYPFDIDATWMEEAFGALFSVMEQKTDENTGNVILYHKADGTTEVLSNAETALRDALVETLEGAGIEVITDNEEAQRVLDMANEGVRLEAKIDGLRKASNFILSFLQGKTNQRKTKLEIPERANRLAEKAIGHKINSHTINGNELAHAKKRHGVNGTANTENTIPLRDEDFALMPYIMSAPTRVVKGNMASNGTESVRYEKELSNGVVIVVEREGRFDVSDMENITMWAQKKSATNVTVAQRASHSTSETIVISETDAAKIRKDAEDAIRKEEKIREHRVYHGTKADFEEFDTNHMGEGEGSQAFGWGIYVTEVEGIGKYYAEIAEQDGVPYEDWYREDAEEKIANEALEHYGFTNCDLYIMYDGDGGFHQFELANYEGSLEEIRAYFEEHEEEFLDSYSPDDYNLDIDDPDNEIEDFIDIVERSIFDYVRDIASEYRHFWEAAQILYTIDIPDDNGSNYLYWDKPIGEETYNNIIANLPQNTNVNFDSSSTGRNVYEELEERLGSDEDASLFLSEVGLIGVSMPANYFSGGREDVARNYVIFKESDAKIIDKVKFFRTADGKAYGFTVDGKIYIDTTSAKADTPIHEYAHLWASAFRKNNPQEWANIVELMKGTPEWEEVKKNYPELTTDDEIADEVLAHYSGRRGAERLREEQQKVLDSNADVFEKASAVSAIARVKDALKRFWKGVAEWFNIHFTSAEEVADKVLADMLNGLNPNATEIDAIIAKAKEDGTYMKAPNGKPTNLDERQWAQVRTKSFKNWFGDWENNPEEVSKVVDENGEPLVVYHGSWKTITKFVPQERGERYWFSSNKEVAQTYTPLNNDIVFEEYKREYVDVKYKDGHTERQYYDLGGVHHTYLNARNPLEIDCNGANWDNIKFEGKTVSTDYLSDYAFENGYDGAIFRNVIDGGTFGIAPSDVYVTFKSSQIKSATNNNGNFDPNNDDIRYQFVGVWGANAMDKAEEASVRLDNLAIAREMEKNGKDAKSVKFATGWERGADGKWRYEVGDGVFDRMGELHPERRRLSDSEQKELDDAFEETMQAFERGSLSYKGEITEYTDMADIYEAGGMERKKAERIRDLEDRERELRDNPKRLDDYLDNDELFAAYPELRNILVDTSREEEAFFGKMGSYNPWNNTLYLNDTSHSTLAHEVQHAIQRIEGFERGGSPETVRQKIKDLINENKDASDYAKSRLRLYAEAKVNEFFLEGSYNTIIKSDNPAVRRYAIEKYWDAMNFIDNAEDSSLVNEYPDLSPDEIALSGYHVKEAVEELKRLAKSYKEDIPEGSMNALNLVQKLEKLLQEKNDKELYAALGGEVESRNVEKRLSMSMDERRESLARDTEDVSREDQIFMLDWMGVNMSEDDGSMSLDAVNDRFNEELDDFKNNRHNGLLHLGRPQEILTACGINAESITLSPSVLKKHLKKHGLTTDDLKGLAEAIQKPILCYKHGLRNPNIVVVTELDVRGGKLSVSFELDSNGNVVDVSNISSVHSKEAQIELERLYKMGEEDFSKSLRWVEKEKVLDWLSPDSYENPGTTSNQEQFDIAKILQNFKNPKILEENVSDNITESDDTMYRIREKEAPKKTIKVYKLMRLGNDGKLYPLFIDNATPIEMGQWYDGDAPNFEMLKKLPSGIHILNAQTGEYVMDYDTFFNEHKDMFSGKKKTKNPSVNAINWATENGDRFINIRETERAQKRYDGENRQYYNFGINGSGVVSEFAMRPGWHAGTHPTMRQIGKGANRDLRDDSFVWVEGEIAADNDYNAEAQRNPDKDLPGKMPIDGYYLKATNANKKKSQADRVGWYVSGAFKANRIISDAEARSVIDEWNNANPEKPIDYDYTRESGKEFTEEDARRANEANGVNVDADETVQEVNDRFNEDLETFEKGELPQGYRFDLGLPSVYLKSAGFDDLQISMRASLLSKKAGNEKHPFNASDLKDLVKSIQKPIAIFEYSKNNMRNIIADIQYGGKHFLIGVTLNYDANGIEINSVSGLFPKESHEWIKWIQDGKAIRIDKKEKVLSLIDSLRTNPAESERIGLNLNSVAKVVQNFENPSIEEEKNSSNPLKMKERVEELAEKLNLSNVEIVTNVSQLNGKEKRAKGFFNKRTGKITIVLPNNANIADIEQTLLHEAVVHYGLRQLFETQFDTFLDNVFNNASEENWAKTAHLGFWFSDLITRNKTMQERGMNLFVEFTI